MDSTDNTLANIALFRDLPQQAVQAIASQCRWTRFEAGEQVFDRESDTLDVYFIIQGTVRILNVISDEREVALADLPAGNCFGELAAIDGLKRSARVVATSTALLASLSGPDFLEVLRSYPNVTIQVLERLTRMVRTLDNRVTKLSVLNVSQRIWNELVRLAGPEPTKNGLWEISDMPNHREIAAWSGTSKEQVANAIGELARDGIVKRNTLGLIICNMPRLQAMIKKFEEA